MKIIDNIKQEYAKETDCRNWDHLLKICRGRVPEGDVDGIILKAYNTALREAVKKVSCLKFNGSNEEYIIEEVQNSILAMQKRNK